MAGRWSEVIDDACQCETEMRSNAQVGHWTEEETRGRVAKIGATRTSVDGSSGANLAPWNQATFDEANEKDVGPDCLRGVCLIERVENPAVLSWHRGIGARRCHRSEPDQYERCGGKGKQKDDA